MASTLLKLHHLIPSLKIIFTGCNGSLVEPSKDRSELSNRTLASALQININDARKRSQSCSIYNIYGKTWAVMPVFQFI